MRYLAGIEVDRRNDMGDPSRQLADEPEGSGEGRLRHQAVAAKRINRPHSSFRCAWQKASVRDVTVAKVSAIAFWTILGMGR